MNDKTSAGKNTETELNVEDDKISMTEHLSALLDDEAGSFEQRRVLDELKSSDELCEKLAHFSFIGESMRSVTPTAVVGSSFLANIHEQIDSEERYNEVQLDSLDSPTSSTDLVNHNKQKSWLRPVGGLALAASVAAISVIGVQSYQMGNQQQGDSSTTIALQSEPVLKEPLVTKPLTTSSQAAVATTNNIESTTNKSTDTASNTEYRQANAHARSFLKRYVDSHMQYASTSTFVPSVRVIAYADHQ